MSALFDWAAAHIDPLTFAFVVSIGAASVWTLSIALLSWSRES